MKKELFRDDYVVVTIQPGFNEFPYLMHIEILRWSHKVYLHTLLVFEAIKAEARRRGLTAIHSIIPADDPKNIKFAEMYGGERTDTVLKDQAGIAVDQEVWAFNLEDD